MNVKKTAHVTAPFAKLLGTALALVGLATSTHSQTVDSFNPGADGWVYSLAVQADGKILVGGLFSTLDGGSRSNLGRLNADGTLDSTFNPGVSSYVFCLAVQSDGKILVGGGFNTLAGQTRRSLGRLNADGTLDSTFNTGVDAYVYSLVVQADGKIVVGGAFVTLGGQPRRSLGRLNANGTLDSTFNPGGGGDVQSLAVQPDGKILVGGYYGLGRLNADGTLDGNFNPGANNNVSSLAVQADGKILVGGAFNTLAGQSRTNIGRVYADGTLDSTFNPGGTGANNYVSSLAVQTDGKILVGGRFTTLGGQSRTNIGRLNADGTLDSTFDPGANQDLTSLAVQADGKILLGGGFTTLGGQTRNHLGRLNNTAPATQSLGYDGSTITWLRGGTSPEVWRTTFDYSEDGLTWTKVGGGTRIPGGWQLAGVAPLTNGTLRARGYVTGEAANWFVETDIGVVLSTERFASITLDGDGGLRATVVGPPGRIFTLQGTPDLSQWTDLGLYTNQTGTLVLTIVPPAGQTTYFYRTHSP